MKKFHNMKFEGVFTFFRVLECNGSGGALFLENELRDWGWYAKEMMDWRNNNRSRVVDE